ncbi:cytochrome C oxidase subunit IV family protein [Aliamphritea spongicola]|uniref:cytochrome C oxidase subunit IV family protein n=1 Tax=Aliamphritea spongicola TaxID=707589 RepID=UPI00196B05C1|nr:cytochrome C oxidase subunit IV family protein [Aliamphritea spongicola]MBN3564181.1 cytochrome C oxidase subunit IV family protein [Aliamphritea spongicola]
MSEARLADSIWILLILVTVAMAYFGENGAITFATVVLILSASAVKAFCVVDYFMGLRKAPRVWRFMLLAYAPVIGVIVSVTYLF